MPEKKRIFIKAPSAKKLPVFFIKPMQRFPRAKPIEKRMPKRPAWFGERAAFFASFAEPLGNNEYRTKLFGLRVLKGICRSSETSFLGYRLYRKPENFSINHFREPSAGRLIIRSDPDRGHFSGPDRTKKSYKQLMEEWVAMPRMNFYLERQPPQQSEKLIRRWMQRQRKRHGDIIFIVHKTRPLADYEMSVQVNADLTRGGIIISTTKARTDKFRDEQTETSQLEIGENGRIKRIIGTSIVLPEQLRQETIRVLQDIVNFSRLSEEKTFETSFVTYKDAPEKPEFYDLIFGKKY